MTRLHTGALCSKSSSQPSSCERGATASGAAVGATLATPATSSSVTNAGIIGCLAMSKFIACALWSHRWPAASGVRFGRFPEFSLTGFRGSGLARFRGPGSGSLRAGPACSGRLASFDSGPGWNLIRRSGRARMRRGFGCSGGLGFGWLRLRAAGPSGRYRSDGASPFGSGGSLFSALAPEIF